MTSLVKTFCICASPSVVRWSEFEGMVTTRKLVHNQKHEVDTSQLSDVATCLPSCDGEARVQRPSTRDLFQLPRSDFGPVKNDINMISNKNARMSLVNNFQGSALFVACVFGGQRCQDMYRSDGAGI